METRDVEQGDNKEKRVKERKITTAKKGEEKEESVEIFLVL